VPQTLLWELAALLQILCLDFRGPTSKGRMGKGMRGEQRGKRGGEE